MTAAASSAIWHDVECGSYAADLELWEDMAGDATGPILDLGCGTGRVALHLASRGHSVVGVDINGGLVDALNTRGADLPATATLADARRLALKTTFALVLAPMQLLQLFAVRGERIECLRGARTHLAPGGLLALAIVEEIPPADPASTPLPDIREIDGWVYSSLPVDSAVDEERIRVRRLRHVISPSGELSEETDEVVLARLSAGALEREARVAGLRPVERRTIPPTDAHVGSTVVVFEREP